MLATGLDWGGGRDFHNYLFTNGACTFVLLLFSWEQVAGGLKDLPKEFQEGIKVSPIHPPLNRHLESHISLPLRRGIVLLFFSFPVGCLVPTVCFLQEAEDTSKNLEVPVNTKTAEPTE